MNHRVGTMLTALENIAYVLVAVLFVAMAGYTLVDAFRSLANVSITSGGVANALTGVLNDALFVIILMELLKTVISHLAEGGFQLRPFLIIGIISAVRRILVLGAQLSASRRSTNTQFNHALTELALDTVVAVVLTLALYVVQRMKREEVSKSGGLVLAHEDIVTKELVGTSEDDEQL